MLAQAFEDKEALHTLFEKAPLGLAIKDLRESLRLRKKQGRISSASKKGR
jgi:hypothetical protein